MEDFESTIYQNELKGLVCYSESQDSSNYSSSDGKTQVGASKEQHVHWRRIHPFLQMPNLFNTKKLEQEETKKLQFLSGMKILTVLMPWFWALKIKERTVERITEVRGAAADTQNSLGLLELWFIWVLKSFQSINQQTVQRKQQVKAEVDAN